MKRFLSLILAVVMCVSIIPMTLIDALAHGRGVGQNNIENQSIPVMSQLPEQVNVDGKTGDTAWDELEWNVADRATGTWDVKDPLNYDYSYKYQLRMDGEYFYGIIVLGEKVDAVLTVMLNDGTNDNAGYTDYLQFDVKADGSFTTAHSFKDGDDVLPAEKYDDASAINNEGQIVIEFKTLLKSFTESSALTSFVSVSIEGVQGDETLYYPRVPYTNVNHDVPTATNWPENSVKVTLADIKNDGTNNDSNVLPSPIEIDGKFKEAMWVEFSNYYDYGTAQRNQYDFKNGDSSESVFAYKPASLYGKYSTHYFLNDNMYYGDDSRTLKFKYSYRYDETNLYFSAIVYDADPASTPYLYLYTHYGDYDNYGSGSQQSDANDTFIIHNSGYQAWHYDYAYTGLPTDEQKIPDGFQSHITYLDASIYAYEMKIPISSIRNTDWGSEVSYIVRVRDTDNNGQNAIASRGGYGGDYDYTDYASSLVFEGIEKNYEYGENNQGGYSADGLNDTHFINLIASDKLINPGMRGGLGEAGSTGKGEQIIAELNVDYDYLYGAVMVNTESFWPTEVGYKQQNPDTGWGDMIRIYIKNGKTYTNKESAGSALQSADGYLSFYIQKDATGNYNARAAYTNMLTNETIEDVASADVSMLQLTQTDGTGHFVPLEFRIPLSVIGVTVSTEKDASGTIFSWYASVESQGDNGSQGLVYPRPAQYAYFYENITTINDVAINSQLLEGVFYPQYWHAGFDKEVTYKNNLVDTITIDGKLEEFFWDNTDDMITVSQYNGVWENEPQGNNSFIYDYKIYNAPDHIYGAAIIEFPANADTTKFKLWTKREGAAPRNVTIYVDASGEAHAEINVGDSNFEVENSDSIRVMATSINNRSVIEFSLKNDRANLGEYEYAVSVTHVANDGEELTLFHLGDKDGWTPLWLTGYNTDSISSNGGGVIYNKNDIETAYAHSDWWDYYLFAPAGESYGDGVFKVLGSSLGSNEGTASVENLFADAGVDAIPEGGFVYCLHTGNNYSIDYTSTNSLNGCAQYRSDFTKGALVQFEELDTENFEKIEKLSDDEIAYYENGYYPTAKYKIFTTVENLGNENLPTEAVWHKNAEKVEALTFYNRELIEIDGSLGDSGWDDNRWNEVNRLLNASYQTTDYRGAEDTDFRYQMRTDGKYIYIAAEIYTDIEGQITGPGSADETATKLTDLPSFRIWIKGDDEDDANKDGITGDSLTFTHLYDLSIQASQQTITGVKTTYYTGETFADEFSETASHNGDHYVYDAEADTLKPNSVGMSASAENFASKNLYPVLRFAKTNDNGWKWPSGGNNHAMYRADGTLGYYGTVDNFYEYGKSALYGYTEKLEENTVSGLGDKWYSEPDTVKTTFGNEHGVIEYDESRKVTTVEFKIELDEVDKDRNGFEYYVHVATTGYGATNPYTIFYPSIQHEPLSNNIYMMYNLPYWDWYEENSFKVDADEYAYMHLRDSYGPVTTLGAKIIDDYNGDESNIKAIRFGAYYNEDFIRWPEDIKHVSDNVANTTLDADKDNVLNYWDIKEVGMLIAPTMLLPNGNSDLVIETDIKHINAEADPITNWVQGSNLADYDTMVYHVPVKNVPTDMKFTFVPYVDYYDANGTKTYYGIPAERSYNYVLNALGGNISTNENVSNFWITHTNVDEEAFEADTGLEFEGTGVIYTEPYDGYTWGLHIAFAPTHVDGVYEITAISDGTQNNPHVDATPLAIPEGGFVWVSTYGNDYPKLYEDTGNTEYSGKFDYETEGAKAAIDLARTWIVGDTIAFYGWTLGDEYNIPTTTPTLDWYEDAYVCTATVEKVDISGITYEYDENVIAYIPIDDRPVNLDREIYQAEAAGFTILTPDHEDLKTYLNEADVVETFDISFYNSRLRLAETGAIYTTDYTFTEGDQNSIYNINVAFTPTSESGVYEITQIADYNVNGASNPKNIPVPNGGFVYVGNGAAFEDVKIAKTWKVSDRIKVTGLDNASNATTSAPTQMTFTVVNDESRIGNRENILAWLEDIYVNGIDSYSTGDGEMTVVRPKYYAFSMDMMLSGGLVGSRAFAYLDEYDAEYTLENEALDLVKTIASDENTYTVAFDTIMRLATTGNFLDHSLSVYGETRDKGGLERYQLDGTAGKELTIENIKNYWCTKPDLSTITYNLTQSQIDDYFASRERKLILIDKIIEEIGADLDYLYIGTDDSKPQETVQSNERRYIISKVEATGIASSTSVMAATDELGLLSIANIASDMYTDGKKVPVKLEFIDGDANIAYEKNPSDDYDIGNYEETLLSHIIGAGAEIREDENDNYLHILVVPRTTAEKDFSVDTETEKTAQNKAVAECLDILKDNLANNIPTVLVNAIGANGQNLYFLEGAASDGTKFVDMDLMKLYGYSQWNTVANATGIALGNAIARYAYLASDAEVTEKSNVAFIKAMATSYAKDMAYIANIRANAYDHYYDLRDMFQTKVSNASYYTDLGVLGTTPSVVIGDYERLANWDHRDFEAQIPVFVDAVNVALDKDYKDVVLNGYDSDRGTNTSEYGFNLYKGKLTDGVWATKVTGDTSNYTDWYAFRTNYDDFHDSNSDTDKDGKIGTNNNIWLNTDNSIAKIDIDLGSAKKLDLARIHYGDNSSTGDGYAPNSMVIYVSDDGTNWRKVSAIAPYSEQGTAATPYYTDGVYWVTAALGGVSAQYVRVEIDVEYVKGAYTFLSEIQLWSEPTV